VRVVCGDAAAWLVGVGDAGGPVNCLGTSATKTCCCSACSKRTSHAVASHATR
jgi:hypothetical protein